jgi:hypothetical protein
MDASLGLASIQDEISVIKSASELNGAAAQAKDTPAYLSAAQKTLPFSLTLADVVFEEASQKTQQ